MVDDRTDRPYRSNEPAARSAPAKASPSGSDPLAELARLIGQNDPFSEFGRDANRRVAPPQPQQPAHDWDAQPAGAGIAPPPLAPELRAPAPQVAGNDYYDQAPAAAPQNFAQNFGRQPFGGAPLAGGDELYRGANEVPGYPPQGAGYEDDRYDPNNAHHAGEEQDFYDDEPPSRKRMGIMVIAGVFALAVIGTAGAFGYRALFGTSSVSGPPPVIKADTAPSKIVPAAAQSGKQITDRVNDKGIGEKLVSREEQPVAVTPQSQGQTSGPAPMGSGIVGSEPKKVRTIVIHPDQAGTADAPAAAPPSPQPPARAVATPPARPAAAPPPRVVSNSPPAADAEPPLAPAPTPAQRPPVARTTPPAQQAQASGNAPLSLSPDATPARPAPAARAPAAPARTAAVTPRQAAPAAASVGGAGGYAVQVSSQRSEAEAQAAFRSLQGKFPGQLGGKQAVIRKVELGDKGTYYRAMVPAGSSAEATEMCNGMKAAGGSCIIQRN